MVAGMGRQDDELGSHRERGWPTVVLRELEELENREAEETDRPGSVFGKGRACEG